jgi:hypothetical protein
MMIQEKLQINRSYSEKLRWRETLERIASRYMKYLREVITHCWGEDATGYSPADFPLAH